jgi:predicted regulator of Ras-like GTPase activity (Roadblock/LC7/MglB family)
MTSINDRQLRDTALVFYKDDVEAIESILDAFLRQSEAKVALLVDQDGHMVTARGQTNGTDLDTISALVAGSFAATRALAHQFGEKEFTALFHQGKSGNIQLSLVGERALLTALFDDHTPIGRVRLYQAEAAKVLTSIFQRKQAAARAAPARAASEPIGGQAFSDGSASALDGMFGK